MNTYEKIEKLMNGRDKKKLDHNTYATKKNDVISVRLHDTDIIKVFKNGKTVLDSGGWRTATTKDRMNKFTSNDIRIFTDRGIWYVKNKSLKVVFKDGMTAYQSGAARGVGDLETEKKKREQVLKYTKDFIEAMRAGKVPEPSGGDCWYCFMADKDGRTMGEITKNDHLIRHMKEKYYVPSLLTRALKYSNANKSMFWTLYEVWNKQEKIRWGSDWEWSRILRVLRKYMYHQLGI